MVAMNRGTARHVREEILLPDCSDALLVCLAAVSPIALPAPVKGDKPRSRGPWLVRRTRCWVFERPGEQRAHIASSLSLGRPGNRAGTTRSRLRRDRPGTGRPRRTSPTPVRLLGVPRKPTAIRRGQRHNLFSGSDLRYHHPFIYSALPKLADPPNPPQQRGACWLWRTPRAMDQCLQVSKTLAPNQCVPAYNAAAGSQAGRVPLTVRWRAGMIARRITRIDGGR